MKLKIMLAGLVALALAPPALAQTVVRSSDNVTGVTGAAQVTTTEGRNAKVPVYVPVRPDGSVIDASATPTPPSGASATQVRGNGAAGAAADTNPVQMGAVYPSALQSLSGNQRGNLTLDAGGNLQVLMKAGQGSASDGFSNGNMASAVLSQQNGAQGAVYPFTTAGLIFNGTSWDRQRGDTNGTYMVGNVASGATDAGNPVKIGCLAGTSQPTLADGQRVNVACNVRGELMVFPKANLFAGADAIPNNRLMSPEQAGTPSGSSIQFMQATAGFVFNGGSWDRQRGDTSGTYVVEVPSATAGAGVASVASTAVTGGQIVKASAGNLYGFNVVSGASAGYVLVFNSATVPADGAVTPARCLPIAANTGIDVNLRGQPAYFSAGITIVFSTTGCFNKTASATAFISGDAK